MTRPEESAEDRAARRRWTAAVVGLLALVLIAQGFLISYALNDPSVVAERDYYRKAVAWDDRQAQQRRNAELGWSLALRERPSDVPGARRLEVTLRDAQGAALSGAQLQLLAFHKARAGERVEARLLPSGGAYAADLPLVRPGRWELRFRAVRGAETFTARLERDLAALEASP